MFENIRSPIAHSGFQSGISQRLKPKSRFVLMRRLLGVANIKLNVIGTEQRKKILCPFKYLVESVFYVF